jgi:hypothetical protein
MLSRSQSCARSSPSSKRRSCSIQSARSRVSCFTLSSRLFTRRNDREDHGDGTRRGGPQARELLRPRIRHHGGRAGQAPPGCPARSPSPGEEAAKPCPCTVAARGHHPIGVRVETHRHFHFLTMRGWRVWQLRSAAARLLLIAIFELRGEGVQTQNYAMKLVVNMTRTGMAWNSAWLIGDFSLSFTLSL